MAACSQWWKSNRSEVGVCIHQGDKSHCRTCQSSTGSELWGSRTMAECWSENWEQSDSEEAGASVRLHHWAESAPAVWIERLEWRLVPQVPEDWKAQGEAGGRTWDERLRVWREEAGPQVTLEKQQDLVVQMLTWALWAGLPGGRVLQGGWEYEGYSLHPALRIGSLVANSTPGCPMEARKSRRSTVWILKSTRTVTGVAGESDRESGVNLQKVWGGPPPGLQRTSQGEIC